MGAGAITDGVMALYSGTCSALTQIACSDDNTAYPGSANDLLPLISATGLTPGSTVYLRYFGYGSSSGTFGICVTTATNDNCANALYICDLNGYNASTSAAYTPDRPGNMRGNNEDVSGTNMPDGTNTGGIFGQGGSWGVGAPFYDVTINNNSWIKFTAASSTAVLQVSVYDCWVGNYPSGGLQMQIFEGTNCTNFVPVSDFKESSTGFSITANNLTVGNDYYLMVDGFAGDICNYSITAQSGVQFPDITDVPPICNGQSVTLTAPAGATSYEWQHDGSTSQSVTVSPVSTQTYFCEVSGLCGYKQMLDVTVQVNQNPTISIIPSASSVCLGNSATLNANGANSYSWSTSQTGTSILVSPTSATSYTVTGTSNGCTSTSSVLISVNPLPVLTASPTETPSDCGGSNGAILGATASGAGSLTYEWTNGSGTVVGTSANLTGVPAGAYFIEVTDANNCSEQFGPFSITNPGAPGAPALVVSDNTPCVGSSVQLSVNTPGSGVTYNWTGPNGFTSSNTSVTLDPISIFQEGTYCVNATISGCTGPASCEIIDVLTLPIVDIPVSSNDSTICTGSEISLIASGATTFVWSGPNGFSDTGNSINISPATFVNEGYYTVTGTDANGCMNKDSLLVDILSLPTLFLNSSASNGIACLNATVAISASGAESYSWEGPNSFISIQAQATIPNAESVNEGWYSVTGTDINGCSATDSLFIDVISDFSGGVVDGDSILCPGETALLSAQGGVSYVWSGPMGFSSFNSVATIESIGFQQSGWYEVILTDAFGCVYVDSVQLLVEFNEDCIFIPNLFTPDLDGNNDTWVIPGLEYYQSNSVEIYNRWGNMIYSASPYLNDWDGSVNSGIVVDGKDGKVPVGTYFYILKLNANDQPPYKGYVEVQF
jgi:gliding motility-associated-like protein